LSHFLVSAERNIQALAEQPPKPSLYIIPLENSRRGKDLHNRDASPDIEFGELAERDCDTREKRLE